MSGSSRDGIVDELPLVRGSQPKLPGEVAELRMGQLPCTKIDVRATQAAANVFFITSSPVTPPQAPERNFSARLAKQPPSSLSEGRYQG